MATKNAAKKPAKKAAKKAPAKKSAVKKVAQKTSKTPTKRVDAVSSARQDTANKNLNEAIRKNNIKKVQTLITQGVDVNARDKEGWTPLHFAAELGHTGICQLLIHAGADIHAQSSKFDQTALHLAADNGALECCKTLIQAGADIHAKNDDDSTPLHLAAALGSVAICQLLIKSGADVNAFDNAEMKPIDLIFEEEGELASLLRGAEKPVAKKAVKKTANKKPTARKVPAKQAAKSETDPGCKEVAQLVAKFLDYAPYLGKGGSKLEATAKAEVEAAAKTVLRSAQDKSLYHGQLDRGTIADELLKLKVLPPEATKEDVIALLDQLDVGHVPGQEHPLAGLFSAVFPGYKL